MIYLSLLFFSWLTQTETAQPYFPSQITFIKEEAGRNYTYAIDEINQRAYYTQTVDFPDQLHVYAMKHIPYTTPDSPQSKYYVMLEVYQKEFCQYTTAWQYGGVTEEYLPSHWFDEGKLQIGNYVMYAYEMIHSHTNASNEDYWYSSVNCTLDSGDPWPCEEMFFKKDTDIPLRYRYIVDTPMQNYQFTHTYHIISIGKPDDRLFQTIPQNWMDNCTDLNLGLDFDYPTATVHLHESIVVGIRLLSPPHRVNGNDTMILRWEVYKDHSDCIDCITWEPKEFYFNIENFHQFQNLTVTRVKNGPQTTIRPLKQGGEYEKLRPFDYLLLFI